LEVIDVPRSAWIDLGFFPPLPVMARLMNALASSPVSVGQISQ
jgi:hypothetical protein